MPTPTRDGNGRVVLFVREDIPETAADRVASLTRRLDSLVEAGAIVSYSTVTWSKRQPWTDLDASIQSRYASFREWATAADVSLTPSFGSRTCYSSETGERSEWLVLPVVCLAVYDDQNLQAVYPHVDEKPQSVLDGLDGLESAGPESPSGIAPSEPAD